MDIKQKVKCQNNIISADFYEINVVLIVLIVTVQLY